VALYLGQRLLINRFFAQPDICPSIEFRLRIHDDMAHIFLPNGGQLFHASIDVGQRLLAPINELAG
jgi:hypothetical protein